MKYIKNYESLINVDDDIAENLLKKIKEGKGDIKIMANHNDYLFDVDDIRLEILKKFKTNKSPDGFLFMCDGEELYISDELAEKIYNAAASRYNKKLFKFASSKKETIRKKLGLQI